MTTLIRPTKFIRQLQADNSIPGNILFINDDEILTTNGKHTTSSGYNTTGLSTINSFEQLPDSDDVIAAVHWKHCLVIMNRVTHQTMPIVGSCRGESGYKDGQLSEARMTYPMDIILSKKHPRILYLSELAQSRIREVDLRSSSKGVTTIMTTNTYGCLPVRMVMNEIGDSIYFTSGGGICKFYFPTKAVQLVAGAAPSKFGYHDHTLLNSLFSGLEDIIQVSAQVFLVAETTNHRLRILNIGRDDVSSVCTGGDKVVDGSLFECEMQHPFSLLYFNDTLYVGEQDAIRQVKGKITPSDIP